MSHVGYIKTSYGWINLCMLYLLLLYFLLQFTFILSSFSISVKHWFRCLKKMRNLILWVLLYEIYLSLISLSQASFYGDGFVQLKATESSDHNTLRIRFRTSSTNGLLFLAAGQTDYLLLELHAGRLQVGTSVAPAHEHMCSSLHEHTGS